MKFKAICKGTNTDMHGAMKVKLEVSEFEKEQAIPLLLAGTETLYQVEMTEVVQDIVGKKAYEVNG